MEAACHESCFRIITKAETIRAIAARQATALATAQATFDALLQQAFAARQPG